MGCMRLSTAPNRDEDAALAVIHAALDAGVRLLDTADAYCHDHRDLGHNERLVARALKTWTGTDPVLVATKGGLTRPRGRWVADGSAKHLWAACEASLRALDLPSVALYQLHAPDPRVSLKTSVKALLELQRAGLIARIGLCNVNRQMLGEVAALADIAAVQVAVSPHADDALFGGLLDWCEERHIPLLAHTPLGGPKRRAGLSKDAVLRGVAERHDASAAAVALGWLRALSPVVVPLPGPSRVETARGAGEVVPLTDADQAELDARFAGGSWVKRREGPPPEGDGEVVLLMGIQGAGKSTAADAWEARGYGRLNRDARGGRLAGLNEALERGLAAGRRRWVLDNTYASRAARARVISIAWRHHVPVRCVWLDTPVAEAQINAVRRIHRHYGRLPEPEELSRLARRDPHAFDPRAQFRFQRELERPRDDEGFSAIEIVSYARRPAASDGSALLIQIEGVLRSSKSGERAPLTEDDVVVHHDRARRLAERANGRPLLGISWQPAVAAGSVTRARVEEVMAHTLRVAGLQIDVRHCPHAAGPPRCWCRTPLPGLAVSLVEDHALDPARCTLVGRSAPDKTLAERMGFAYEDHEAFFAGLC